MHHVGCSIRIPAVFAAFRSNGDLPIPFSVLVSIGDKVHQHLHQAGSIRPGGGQILGNGHSNRLVFLIHLLAQGAQHFIHHPSQRNRLEFQPHPPGFNLGIIVQVGNQGVHAVNIGTDGCQEIGLRFGNRTYRPSSQQFSVPLDGGHRVF